MRGKRVEAKGGFMHEHEAAIPVLLFKAGLEAARRNHQDRCRRSLLAGAQYVDQGRVLVGARCDVRVANGRTEQSVAFQQFVDSIEVAPLGKRADVERIAQVSARVHARDCSPRLALPFAGRVAGERKAAVGGVIGQERAAGAGGGDADQARLGTAFRIAREQRAGGRERFDRADARRPAGRKQRVIGARRRRAGLNARARRRRRPRSVRP